MKPEDQERFIQSMGILAEAFQKKPSTSMAEIYWRVLQDMSIEDFEQACLNLINTRKITGTFPMVAEIREASGKGESLDTRVALAWDKLMFAVRTHGYYDSVKFDDPVIPLILSSWGGWMKWSGEVKEDELKWARKDFDKLYRAYAATCTRDNGKHLPGAFEHENGGLVWEETGGRRVELKIILIGGDQRFDQRFWQIEHKEIRNGGALPDNFDGNYIVNSRKLK